MIPSAGDDLVRQAFEAAPSGLLLADADGRILLVNHELERLFGYGRGELLGLPVEVLVPASLRERHVKDRQGYLEDPNPRLMGRGQVLRGLRKDGTEVPLEIGLRPLRVRGGTCVLSSMIDVSDRLRSERQLRQSEERFRILVESLADHAIVMVDTAGRVQTWNTGAARITGYSAEETLGRSVAMFSPDPAAAVAELEATLERAAREGQASIEGWRTRKDGSRYLADIAYTPLRDTDGTLTGFARVMRDVTLKREMDERLRQAAKLEAIGTLAGGIAHDFNNVLLGIVGFAELALMALEARPDVQRDLHHVLRACQRGRELVRRILTFSRSDEVRLTPTRLDGVLGETLDLLRSSIPATIRTRLHVDPSSPHVLADETQIQQILMNAVTNSVHAIGQRPGRIDVGLAPYHPDEEFARAHPELGRRLLACLTIADDGAGMPPEVLERIFEPFFTTKPRESGTGLGLAVVHGIVKAHGGAIDVESRVGSGTTLRIYLPTAKAEVAAETEAGPGAPRAHLLVVEDEDLLAVLARRLLESMGYSVTVHTSSLQALEDFRGRPRAFDGLLTDHTMPHMSGLALAEEVKRIRPDLPILMLSGLGATLGADRLRQAGVQAVLAKPFVREELEAAVAALLAVPGEEREPPPA